MGDHVDPFEAADLEADCVALVSELRAKLEAAERERDEQKGFGDRCLAGNFRLRDLLAAAERELLSARNASAECEAKLLAAERSNAELRERLEQSGQSAERNLARYAKENAELRRELAMMEKSHASLLELARAEIADLKDQGGQLVEDAGHKLLKADREVAAAQAREARLHAELRRYGAHHPNCQGHTTEVCSCGFSRVMAETGVKP